MSDRTVGDRPGPVRRDGGRTDRGGAPPWLTLTGGETLRWRARPRIQTVLPSVVAGVVLAAVLVVAAWAAPVEVIVPRAVAWGAAIVVGALPPTWSYLRVRTTEYVVTDRGLYRREGILGRSVTVVDYETVQNVSFSRSVTGRLFDHGTLTFDTAGGNDPGGVAELSFDDVDAPRDVQSLVDEQLARVRGRDAADAGGGRRGVPGTTDQWQSVLEEVRALRRALEAR